MEPIEADIKYLGKTPRTFNLPIPFLSRMQSEGEVTCNPVGRFPAASAKALIDLNSGMFELIQWIYPEGHEDIPLTEEKSEPDVPRGTLRKWNTRGAVYAFRKNNRLKGEVFEDADGWHIKGVWAIPDIQEAKLEAVTVKTEG